MDNKTSLPINPLSLIDYDEEQRRNQLRIPRHSSDFYAELAAVIRDPGIRSCSYFGFGDHQTLQVLAAEQERRALAQNVSKKEAFPFGFHCEVPMLKLHWGSFDPYFERVVLRNPSVWINDWPLKTTTATFLGRVMQSTADIVFSSVPQTLGLPPFGSTLERGYLIYRVNGRDLSDEV